MVAAYRACFRFIDHIQAPLSDHPIRPRQHPQGDRQTHLRGSFQIYDQLELGGLLYGKLGWAGAFKNFIDVSRGTPVQIDGIRAIEH
jgi:hypothetical protein